MAEYLLYGKRRLCYTEVSDYTDYQGIGHDPLYKRFDSVFSVVKNLIANQYQHFLAQPIYSSAEDQIEWYIENWEEQPIRYNQLNDEDKSKYTVIKNNTLSHYKEALISANGEDLQILASALKFIDDDSLYCYDNKVVVVAWGMKPDSKQHKITGAIIHEFKYERKYKLSFNVGVNGELVNKLEKNISRTNGFEITHKDLPQVIANEGYKFIGWLPNPIGIKVKEDLSFSAKYEKLDVVSNPIKEEPNLVTVKFFSGESGVICGTDTFCVEKGAMLNASQIPKVQPNLGKRFVGWSPSINIPINSDIEFTANFDNIIYVCKFDAGLHGNIHGNSTLQKILGSSIEQNEIPIIKSHKGYKFTGWDSSPLSIEITCNRTFTAQYEKLLPWYKKLWIWFTGCGCLKWLLWLFILLLVLLLLSYLIRGCNSCSRIDDSDEVRAIENIETPKGIIDDNNNRDDIDIIKDDGTITDGSIDNIVAPIVGDDGTLPPIEENPGAPSIVANRLNIYFENDNVDLNAFAKDFKSVYEGDEYQIIGYDDNVKMVQIQIPENERNFIRESINTLLPQYKFFVVDESIFQCVGHVKGSGHDAGWHLKAINVFTAWEETRGDNDIVVAVVDDGIDYQHPIFAGKIINAYNVFTQNNQLSYGTGHGTHVAGLAVGSSKYVNNGVSGIAPNCQLMPIQVFDNKICTFSSITSGIMYAIHKGADVVNISIGPSFNGLNVLPIETQKQIARTQFKNEEKVWNKIIQIANKNNTILVFAVGNDNVLASLPPENRTNNSVNVAAVDKHFSAATFSNFGEGANISAPGVDIYSSYPTSSFQYFDGTSMSAPIVAGTVALMKSIDEDININQVLNVLQKTGKPISHSMPPMVLVDKALLAVKNKDYSKGISNVSTEIDNDSNSNNSDSRGDNSLNKGVDSSMGNGNNNVDTNDEHNENRDGENNDGTSPHYSDDKQIDNDKDSSPEGTDYDMIRKLIESYKRKIAELEKQLPENKNR